MKKKKKIFLLVALVMTTVFVGGLLFKNNSKQSISTILSKRSYAYLPKEAKEYIEKVYEETGEVILTEKNKEDNKPYLNPDYIEYLELSEKEKENIDLIPDAYILDYSVNQTYGGSELPSTFDLRNRNGHNFVSPIKNQGSTSICWAFASIENVETLYMKNNNQSYSDLVPKFSIRQMDYITSSDSYLAIKGNWSSGVCTYSSGCSWTYWENANNGSHELDKGGNFFTSSIAMANGITLTDESVMPWHEEKKPALLNDIYGYDKSLYEVNSTIQMPTINKDYASEEVINSYVNDVKTYMMEYGGPFVGTYSPKSTCGFQNTDGSKVLKTDDCVSNTNNKDLGHAMQIIGWDDEYEYSYCESGTTHKSVNSNGTCSSGELTTGKGAWILRNSWGEDSEEGNAYKYVYLTYDSTRLSIGFTTSVSEMTNRSWDNNYHGNPWIERNISNGMASVSEQTKEFDTHNTKSEKIEKIKFVTASKNGKYTLSIITDDNEYNNIAVVNSNEVGVYTMDLSNKNIIVQDNNFTVKIVSENDDKFYNDSISVFTSNIDNAPSVSTYSSQAYDSTKSLSNDNPLYVGGDNYWSLTVKTYLKNMPSNADLTYRIKKDDGVIATESQIADFKKTIINDFGEANFSGFYSSSNSYFSTREAYGKTYTFEVVYDDIVVDSFPIKFSGKGATTKSTIRLHANNGTDYYYSTTNTDNTNVIFNNISSLQTAEFYNNGYYIVGWNTKADGTGTSYSVDEAIPIYKDTDLYAQWSNEKLNVVVTFDCKEGGSCYQIDGKMESQTLSLDDKITLPINNYTREGYVFNAWWIDRGSYVTPYFEETTTSYKVSDFVKYPVFNNTKVSVYANWLEDTNYYTITFDSNEGTGSMAPINLKKYVYSTNLSTSHLKENKFTKTGYAFTGWNTKADGTGTSYNDKGAIQSESDITLYAQWEVANKYTITFNANNGTNDSTTQGMPDSIAMKLNKNTFTKTGYTFTGWNTKADKTGTSYTDEQSVSLSDDLVLYAQWEINKYTITFNSNGGTGTLNPQQVSYNTSTKLSKNAFTKDGFKFAGWNTKADGTGTSYTNEQSVALSNDLTLYAQWSEGDPYVINGYNYDEENNYISNIGVNTTLDEYTQNIELLGGYTAQVDTKTVDNKQVLYTGGKTKIYKNQILYAELTNVVSGDTNGDGKINYLDYVNVYNHIQKTKHPENNKKLLVDEYLSAADMSKDNKISYLDYVRIYNKIKELKGGTN